MEFITKLESNLHLNSVGFSGKRNHIVKNFFVLIDSFNKTNDSLRLVITDFLRFLTSKILKVNGKSRI